MALDTQLIEDRLSAALAKELDSLVKDGVIQGGIAQGLEILGNVVAKTAVKLGGEENKDTDD